MLACLGLQSDCNPPPQLPIGTIPEWNSAAYPWPMFAQNPRRTGRSPFNGPASATPGSPRNWTYTAVAGASINIQAAVSDSGVYFGTWGILRREDGRPPDQWDKADGKWFGLKLDAQATEAEQEWWTPHTPALVPAGYLYPGRAKLPRDAFWVGADNDFLVSFFNGTIEGVVCLDPDDGTQYFGRGDGKVYAIDPSTGDVKWEFETYNPEAPTDPDGGGEVVGGIVMGADKTLYFGTFAAPWPSNPPNEPAYETNAVYAIDTQGDLVWRYPSQTASLSNVVNMSPAISPNFRTMYFGTQAGDISAAGQVLALDLSQPAEASDAERLKWSMNLENTARLLRPKVYVRALAVGIDDRIYGCGGELQLFGLAPVVFAIDDRGTSGHPVWSQPFTELQGYPSTTAQLGAGLALGESNGRVDVIFVSTTHAGRNNGDGGMLFAVNPMTGGVMHSFDPASLSNPGVGGMTAPTLGADGTIYVGVRGKGPFLGGETPVNGSMYALQFSAATGFTVVWDFEVEGQLDWVPPAIGGNGGLYFGSTAPFVSSIIPVWTAPDITPADTSPKFYGIFE